MCRLTLYKGKPMLIGDLVTNPSNSLIYQSRDAAYHPGVTDKTHRRNILVNGDGFGVCWYGEDVSKGGCCFKFVTPAWSNGNLRSIGEHVASHLVCAHIRAASSGHDPLHERVAVSHENCHPFRYGRFTFMHNGGIPYFARIKRPLQNVLHEAFFSEIKGSTDSEHIFALFLHYLYVEVGGVMGAEEGDAVSLEGEGTFMKGLRSNFTVEEQVQALQRTITTILRLCESAGIAEPVSLNLCLTDGSNVIATRFRNGSQSPPSLYFNYGQDFQCDASGRFFSAGRAGEDLVVSSAPLSKVEGEDSGGERGCYSCGGENADEEEGGVVQGEVSREDYGQWVLVPKDHMLIGHAHPLTPFKVGRCELRPIVLGVGAEEAARGRKKDRAQAQEGQAAGVVAMDRGGVYKKPKILKFRSKL